MLRLFHSREVVQGGQENTPETAVPDMTSASLVYVVVVDDDGLGRLSDVQKCGGRLSNSEFLFSVDSHLSYKIR